MNAKALFFQLACCIFPVAGLFADAVGSSAAPDRDLGATIANSFSIHLLRDTKDPTLVDVGIQVDHPPADMAFAVTLRSGNRTWPVGPVLWVKDQIESWGYDVDLPEGIDQVDVEFVPSEKARDQLLHDDALYDRSFRFSLFKTMWKGSPIVRSSVPIQKQEMQMSAIRFQIESGHEDPMDLADPDDPVIRKCQRDGDRAHAKAQLQMRAADQPDDRAALFNLACVMAADGDLDGAMHHLIALRNLGLSSDMTASVQRLLRMICGMDLYRAQENHDATAMAALGLAYEKGYGVSHQINAAKRWYSDAANAGNATGMCRLAAIYENEFGATVHTEDAHAWYHAQTLTWYRKAANLGNEEAKQWLAAHKGY